MLHGIENLHVYKFQNGIYDVDDEIIVTHLSKVGSSLNLHGLFVLSYSRGRVM